MALIAATRESAAATAAGKLFPCLIVLGWKFCWIKFSVEYDVENEIIRMTMPSDYSLLLGQVG